MGVWCADGGLKISKKRVEKKKWKKNFIQRHWTDWISCQIELLDILSLYTRNASNMYEHWAAAAAAVAEAEERHHRNISCVCALLWFEYINCLLNDLINFFRRLKGFWCNVDGLMLVCVCLCASGLKMKWKGFPNAQAFQNTSNWAIVSRYSGCFWERKYYILYDIYKRYNRVNVFFYP